MDTLAAELAPARPDAAPAPPPARGFTPAFVASFVVVLLASYAVNFVGNATNLFPSPLRPTINDRSWKSRRLAAHAREGRAPKVVVLGSSRVMQIRPDYLRAVTGKLAFNYGVSAAIPVDLLAQLRYVLSLGIRPELLIVGVDEFSFGSRPNRFTIQAATSWGLLSRVPFPENAGIAGEVLAQVTPGSTWDSLCALCRSPSARDASGAELLLDDGYLIYRQRAEAQAEGTYDLRAEVTRQSRGWSRREGTEPNLAAELRPTPRNVELFRQFLALARGNGAEVRVMLLPLQPGYERRTMRGELPAVRRELDADLRALCAAAGARYQNFTRIASYGGESGEFWDVVHQTPENLRRMVNVLFDLPPDRKLADFPDDAELLEHLPPISTLTTW